MKEIKKVTKSIMMMLAALFIFTGTADAAGPQTIRLDYRDTFLGNSSVKLNGTTWVPLKELAFVLSYNTTWDPATRSITLIRPRQKVTLQVGSKVSKVNGKTVILSGSIRILKSTTYVPLVSMVKALGASTLLEPESGDLHIVDKSRFVFLPTTGRTYWVSRESGELFRMLSTAKEPELLNKLPLKPNTSGYVGIKQVSKESDLVILDSEYVAMFNAFDNSYQTLVTKGKVVKQMNYHYVGPYIRDLYGPKITSPQIYMTDGLDVQYINKDGTLGKLYELDKTTDDKGPFLVEYATSKILLVRSTTSTALVAIDITKGTSENLTQTLITTEDQKEWETADPRDQYVLSRELRLESDDGKELMFTYTTLFTDKAYKVTYKYVE
ncbi:MAG: copper amine oxidase N-terminal domain-containing protein [Paenibacillus sp.]|nr:copper amine oxidase N-terminal domain-containing protein [Paenibacillus sp.]